MLSYRVNDDNDNEFLKRQKAFGKKVKKYREEEDMSQDKLAGTADISVTYLSGIENQKANPSLEVMSKLSQKLGKKLPEMFEDDDDGNSKSQSPKS